MIPRPRRKAEYDDKNEDEGHFLGSIHTAVVCDVI